MSGVSTKTARERTPNDSDASGVIFINQLLSACALFISRHQFFVLVLVPKIASKYAINVNENQSLNTTDDVHDMLSDTNVKWLDDFMGLGYQLYDVRPKLLLIFDKRKTLVNYWNKIIKWWPDDEIKMRFVETNNSYEFVLYGESHFDRQTDVY